MESSDSSSSEDDVVVRRPRIFLERKSYVLLEETYEYNERFRLTRGVFNYVLTSIEPLLSHPTARNQALSAKQQLQIALHWLGSGVQYHCVADMHNVSKATVCRVVDKVVTAVNNTLLVNTVCWPENIDDVVQKFSEIAGMPLICGVVDGTLIKIDAPSLDEQAYVDRHGNHSINVMLVAGPDLQFYYVCANWPGSVSDARVLRNSSLYDRMEIGWRPFPGGVILGDSIYPLKSWLIPPILQNDGDQAQQRFLRAHRQTRRIVECAIGKLKEKFPSLNYLRVNPFSACNIVKCCVVLCNLTKDIGVGLMERNDDEHEALVVEEGDHEEDEQDNVIQAQEKLQFFYNHHRH